MMNKVKNIIVWTLIAAYTVVVLCFIAEKRDQQVCNQVEVIITDSLRNAFVTDDRIKQLIKAHNIDPIGTNFNDINIDSIENILNAYPLIDRTESYKTASGRLVIQIKQRFPILRIIDANNNSYYIDDKGGVMKLSENYTSHVIIANGSINAKFPGGFRVNVLDLEKYAQGKRVIITELYKLAQFITNDKFWNAQIEQIYVNELGDIELVPLVGSQNIILGDISDYEEKFDNLMSMYHNGLPAVGWNKYATINLKYKGQIICTKRESL